ncbi:filamentous hemagglutinin N-terminal domain-containing protein [Selenomonas sp. FC4001]|uniref:two-partner secretion domain-containing protein n=1 Tax=Selenomonas sp. FC4001 TaxID=1408313 RepID=UPI00056B4B68|nr:filamentous hemagglutinin N-terminal domain-containing protein [Selenomonas sp. FC4001]
MRWITKYRKQRMGALAAAIAVTAWMPTAMGEPEANTVPTGANVTNGTATVPDNPTISQQDNKKELNITVNSPKAAIDWDSFDIGSNARVNFNGDNGFVILNRVPNATKASEIYGELNGRGGTVYLINPQGITFGGSARVEVGSLVASTLDIKQADFLADANADINIVTAQGGNGKIKVENAANIKASEGYVALLAHKIENAGTIEAPDIAMAAGQQIEISYDNKINLVVNVSKDEKKPAVIDLAHNYVLMRSSDVNSIISESLIKNTGTIQATRITLDSDGKPVLCGSGSVNMIAANVELNGKITAENNINTTGYESLQVRDSTDVHATSDAGAWNIQAKNITITENPSDGKGDNSNPNKISHRVLSNTLTDTNVNIVASPDQTKYYSDITVTKPIEKSGTKATSLSLTAGRNISVDADIKSTGGALDLTLNSRNMERTNSKREDGATIIRADISTNGGNFTTTGKHGTYFGVKVDGKDGTNIGTSRNIETKGGKISLFGDEVLLATGGVVKLNAGDAGDVFIEGNVNSANAYYNVENNKVLSWADAREKAKQTNVESLKGKIHLAVITSALEDAVATSAITKSNASTKEAFVGGHVVKVKINEAGRPVDAEGKEIEYAIDENGNPEIKGTPVIDEASVQRDASKKVVGVTVMEATDNKGWYIIKDKDGHDHNARFWGWTEGAEAGNIFYVQTTGETVLGKDMESSTDKAWLKNHGAAVYNAKEAREAYVNFAPKEPNDDMGQDTTNATQMALAINYDTHKDNERKEILYSQWDDIGASATQIKNYVVEAELGNTAMSIDGKNVKLAGEVGNLTKLKNVAVNASGNIDVQRTINVENKVKLAGTNIAIGGNITADAKNADDAVVIQAQRTFSNSNNADISLGDMSSWKIYSDNPKDDDFGGLNSGSFAIWGWKGQNTYSSDRNLYIFKYHPTLTITANNATKKFGEVLSDTGYTLNSELSGQYLDYFLDGYEDKLKVAYMLDDVGTKSYGYPASAPLGTYLIDLKNTDDGVAALMDNGYNAYVKPGILTVTGNNPEDVKPQLDPHDTTNVDGSASYTTAPRTAPGTDRVLGLQSAELPFFREENGQTKLYGTYDVSIDPDKVKMEPTAKVLPEPDQPKNQYREYDKEITTKVGTAKFKLTYNGSTFDIYPVDIFGKKVLKAGDAAKNVEVESQALFAAFKEMGITLDDLDGVYTHFDNKKEVQSFRK